MLARAGRGIVGSLTVVRAAFGILSLNVMFAITLDSHGDDFEADHVIHRDGRHVEVVELRFRAFAFEDLLDDFPREFGRFGELGVFVVLQ